MLFLFIASSFFLLFISKPMNWKRGYSFLANDVYIVPSLPHCQGCRKAKPPCSESQPKRMNRRAEEGFVRVGQCFPLGCHEQWNLIFSVHWTWSEHRLPFYYLHFVTKDTPVPGFLFSSVFFVDLGNCTNLYWVLQVALFSRGSGHKDVYIFSAVKKLPACYGDTVRMVIICKYETWSG